VNDDCSHFGWSHHGIFLKHPCSYLVRSHGFASPHSGSVPLGLPGLTSHHRPPSILVTRHASTDVKVRKSEAAAKRKSILDVIKQDHRELALYYSQIVGSTDHDVITRYQNLFVWELAHHAVGKEIVVYPVMEHHLADGKAVAGKVRKQHVKVGSFLAYLLRKAAQ
jgi:hypothetical protein